MRIPVDDLGFSRSFTRCGHPQNNIGMNDVGMLRYYVEQAQNHARNNPQDLLALQHAVQMAKQYAAAHREALQAAAQQFQQPTQQPGSFMAPASAPAQPMPVFGAQATSAPPAPPTSWGPQAPVAAQHSTGAMGSNGPHGQHTIHYGSQAPGRTPPSVWATPAQPRHTSRICLHPEVIVLGHLAAQDKSEGPEPRRGN